MNNIGTTTMWGMVQYTLFLALLCLAFAFGIYILRYRMEHKIAKIFSKELHYEIYYGRERIALGSFQLKNGESKRFGFSKDSRYHNDIILENYLHKIDNLDSQDVDEMKDNYGAWFDVKMFAGEFSVVPAYTARERYSGNKKVYLDEGILNREGEHIESDMHIFGSRENKKAFRIDLYDESQKV